LVEDRLFNEANALYDNIITKYSLEGSEADEFTLGRGLLEILIDHKVNNTSILELTPTQISDLQNIAASGKMWAHARAEGWLFAYQGDAFTDTLLYTDSLVVPVPPTSGNGGGIGRMSNNSVNSDVNKSTLTVYPNPAEDVLMVNYHGEEVTGTLTFQVEDISGRVVVLTQLDISKENSVNISHLSTGIYIYRLFDGETQKLVGKVIKN
jgi:hypothetical protein